MHVIQNARAKQCIFLKHVPSVAAAEEIRPHTFLKHDYAKTIELRTDRLGSRAHSNPMATKKSVMCLLSAVVRRTVVGVLCFSANQCIFAEVRLASCSHDVVC